MVAPKSQRAIRTRNSSWVFRPLLILLVVGGMLLLSSGNRPSSLEPFDTSLFDTDDSSSDKLANSTRTSAGGTGAGTATGTSDTTKTADVSPAAPPPPPPPAVKQPRIQVPSKTARPNVVIVREEDLPPPAFVPNQTTFSIEYFSSMSPCTPLTPSDVSFTLTTQLSVDRLWIMKHQCERWPSPLPIAIVVYLPPNAPPNQDSKILNRLEHEMKCDLTRMKITFFQASPDSPIHQYPVNTLRNLALESITTTHAAYIDSDFLISDGLHEDLITTAAVLANDTHSAVVMPAFEYISNCKITRRQNEVLTCLRSEWDMIPKHHEDIVALREKKERPLVKNGYQSKRGKNKYHGTTMYNAWIESNLSTPIPIPCLKHWTYEPYLAVRVCHDLPKFPEIFKGWGFNKIMWVKILLKKLGFRLWQVSHGFVMHIPHEISISRQKGMDKHPPEFDAYMDWLNTLPAHPDQLPHCSEWKKEHGPLQP